MYMSARTNMFSHHTRTRNNCMCPHSMSGSRSIYDPTCMHTASKLLAIVFTSKNTQNMFTSAAQCISTEVEDKLARIDCRAELNNCTKMSCAMRASSACCGHMQVARGCW